MAVVFVVTLRHGIWRITKDGVFYGDYRTKAHAIEGAEAARKALKQAGRTAKIVFAA